MNTAIDECMKALAAELSAECALVANRVMTDWPDPQKPLAMPSVTITSQDPLFTALEPWILSKSAPDVNNQGVVKRIIGQVDFKLQLDVWARNKAERNRVMQQVFEALNPDHENPGLRLQLDDYHDEWVGFSLTNQKFDDSEASAQRQEWRAMLTLVAQCKVVLVKTEYLMITIENTVTTPDTIEV